MVESLLGFAALLTADPAQDADCLRHGAGRLPRLRPAARLDAALRHGRADGSSTRAVLFAVGGAAVHPDGQSGDPGRLSRRALRGHLRSLGRFRGGLAMASVAACGGFSAVCGSSLATAATMSKVAMPSMRRYGYADSLAAGSIAAGGTLGILIPPSVLMVIYGIMTETDIGKLFIAGIVPGILGSRLLRRAPSPWSRASSPSWARAASASAWLPPCRRSRVLGRHAALRGHHGRHLRRRLHPDRGGRDRRRAALRASRCSGRPRPDGALRRCCWNRRGPRR